MLSESGTSWPSLRFQVPIHSSSRKTPVPLRATVKHWHSLSDCHGAARSVTTWFARARERERARKRARKREREREVLHQERKEEGRREGRREERGERREEIGERR